MIYASWAYVPYIALWLVISLLLIWLRFFITRRHMRFFMKEHYGRMLLHHWSWIRFWGKSILYTLAVIFLAAALLGPESEIQEDTVVQEGRNIVIALDVSRSMLAQDCLPNRLDCAKEKIKKIVRKLSCDRVGLILFSGTAVIMCPLTKDHEAFELFLHDVDAESLSAATTALDKALKKVKEMFESLSGQKNKLAIIATDGEDFSASLTAAKEEVIQQGIRLLTLGVGSSQGSPIPVYNAQGEFQGHLKDDQGAVVISRLNESMLQALARDSNALYMRATSDDADVDQMVSWVQSFEKEEQHMTKRSVTQPYYMYPAAMSLVCLMIEWML